MESTAIFVLRRVTLKIVTAPFWWYTVGLLHAAGGLWRSVLGYDVSLGASLWLRNIFVPLYGQEDIGGRVISFFLRLVNIIVRGLVLLVIGIFHLAIFALWIAAPILLVVAMFR